MCICMVYVSHRIRSMDLFERSVWTVAIAGLLGAGFI